MGRHARNVQWQSARDFIGALVIFNSLISVMTADGGFVHQPFLLRESFPVAQQLDFGLSIGQIIVWTTNYKEFWSNSVNNLIAAMVLENGLIMFLASLLFSSIITFTLAFLRHLRRVHASARRGAWREN